MVILNRCVVRYIYERGVLKDHLRQVLFNLARDRTCYLRNAKNVFYVLWQVAQRYIISFWKPLEHNGVS
jgi:hypothetical protein